MPASYHGSAYRAWLNEDLGAILESKELGLPQLQRSYLRSRWLEQVLRAEYEAHRASTLHQGLRLVAVVGSVLVLMLVSIRIEDAKWAAYAHYLTVGASLCVALSMGIDSLYGYGERGRASESKLQRLLAEGWRFLELSGHYQYYRTHLEAFPTFAHQVENLRQRRVESFGPAPLHEKRGGEELVLEVTKKSESPSPPESVSVPVAERQLVRNVLTRHSPHQPRVQ